MLRLQRRMIPEPSALRPLDSVVHLAEAILVKFLGGLGFLPGLLSTKPAFSQTSQRMHGMVRCSERFLLWDRSDPLFYCVLVGLP